MFVVHKVQINFILALGWEKYSYGLDTNVLHHFLVRG